MTTDVTNLTANPIGTDNLEVLQRNAQDFDRAINGGNTSFKNRAGQTLPSYEKAISDARIRYGAVNNRGSWVTATAYSVNDIWQHSTDNTWYLVLSDYTSGANEAADIALDPRVVQVWQSTGQQPFETVALLKSGISSLNSVGDVVEWSGYNAKGDGGGNMGVFLDASPGTRPAEDNGRYFHIAGGSGQLYVEAVFSSFIFGPQYGLFPSASDQAAQMLLCAQASDNLGLPVLLQKGSYVANTGDFSSFTFYSHGDVTINNTSLSVNNLEGTFSAEYNHHPDFDGDIGNALTLASDEDLGRISRIDIGIPSVTADDTNPISFTEVVDEYNIDNYRIKAIFSGDDADLEIWHQQLLDFNSSPQTLTAGQIATPISFRHGAQQFLRVSKGTGQGQVGISYQFQNPKTKARQSTRIWVIDLDDGLAVRDYDILLPQCSASTMNGQNKLGDSTSLNWIIQSVSGTVELRGEGINPQSGALTQVYKETVTIADLGTSGDWYSPRITGSNINRVRFFVRQRSATQTTTGSNIRMEVDV